jgi:hypothetical protein
VRRPRGARLQEPLADPLQHPGEIGDDTAEVYPFEIGHGHYRPRGQGLEPHMCEGRHSTAFYPWAIRRLSLFLGILTPVLHRCLAGAPKSAPTRVMLPPLRCPSVCWRSRASVKPFGLPGRPTTWHLQEGSGLVERAGDFGRAERAVVGSGGAATQYLDRRSAKVEGNREIGCLSSVLQSAIR